MPRFAFNSLSIHYRLEGDGPPLMLLPGNTASSSVHDGEFAHFARRFTVICPDYIGYGKSTRVLPLPADFWAQNARMAAALAEHLDLGEVAVIGTSGGGIVALNFAIIAPTLVRCLVADSIPGEYLSGALARAIARQRAEVSPEARNFYQTAHGDGWESVVEADTTMMLDAAQRGGSVFGDRLAQIRCPALLTASLGDDLIPGIETGVCQVARQLARCRVVFYPRGGHPLMWSRPDDFRREADAFLAETCSALLSEPAD